MGDKTGIEWTDATWNPVTGCTKVSPGCDHCYAESIARRFNGTPAYHAGFEVTLRPERLDQPLRWQKPRRIFVNSMSDLFHESVPDGFIAAVWFVMGLSAGCIPERYRGHTFQILTKRPARMRAWLRKWADVGDPSLPPQHPAAKECGRAELLVAAEEFIGGVILYDWMDGPRYWPAVLPNVWLGVSAEDQNWAEIRVPALIETPAVVRFVSAEPLLGGIDFGAITSPHDEDYSALDVLDWVIVGGESGHGARPMNPDWARSVRDQCVAASVPFLFKQWGEWAPLDVIAHSDHYASFPGGEQVRRVGKKNAGRELDGRTWDEAPRCG
ncbi:DUF5131 family protein [Rhodococcus sp. 14-2470-1a]|uniref:DUF5131 family protein n=1 Tax=Rhodococcus sp. 14-2470-1a TaxID=2023150 RepID=UPI000B9B06D4|nr:phage Gp37/Gp68 family protein [Rhodococcus sp. 14-2470-1a]OZF47546.1 hypothetical protein CH292_19160 [Rhodococcus sp. 14-2470-1a]